MIKYISRNNKSKFLIKYFSDKMICELNYVAWAAKAVGLFSENYRKSQLRLTLAKYVSNEKIALFHYSDEYDKLLVYSPHDVKILLYDSTWKHDLISHDIMDASHVGWVLAPSFHDNKFNHREYAHFKLYMDRSFDHQNHIHPLTSQLKEDIGAPGLQAKDGKIKRTTTIYH